MDPRTDILQAGQLYFPQFFAQRIRYARVSSFSSRSACIPVIHAIVRGGGRDQINETPIGENIKGSEMGFTAPVIWFFAE